MPLKDEALDLYGVLDLRASATLDEIEEAYARIQDTFGGGGLALYSLLEESDPEAWRHQVDLAYQTLSDPDRRAEYDRQLQTSNDYTPLVLSESDASQMQSVSTSLSGSNEENPRASNAPANPAAPPPLPRARRLKPDPDIEITEDTEFSGTLLKRLRESAGATLAQVAEITKIGRGYLRAIESNDFDNLPAPVYVRGFVMEYARVLGLASKHVASSFMTLYERYRGGGR